MDANRIWVLIGKKIAGNAAPDEVTELESLMAECADNAYPLRELEEMWLLDKNQPTDRTPDEIKVRWENFKTNLPVNNHIFPIKSIRKNNYFIWIAACLIVAFFTIIVKLSIDVFNDNANILTTVVQAPAGSTSKIILPDGSKVWLNANS